MLVKRSVAVFATVFALAGEVVAEKPAVLGRGIGRFEIGKKLLEDQFDSLDKLVVQIQKRSGYAPERVAAKNNTLVCYLPGRGCTIWHKQKFPTRVVIQYDVLCPSIDPKVKGLQPRDINQFWMATDPLDPDKGLFDSKRYTGKFSSYDKIHGYYASSGGGGAVANRTVRMRRYPREVDGSPAAHMALNDKDEKPEHLIKPDVVMKVQLVAFDDLIQYIVDGKLVYEVALGDTVPIESGDPKKLRYTEESLPIYQEGYFGFRMVGTHHIYSNFRVHSLEPTKNDI